MSHNKCIEEFIEEYENYSDIKDCDFVFMCLPTPQNDDGSADINYILDSAKTLSIQLKKVQH